MCVSYGHDMTLAVKVALNPNTTNQPILIEMEQVMNHFPNNRF